MSDGTSKELSKHFLSRLYEEVKAYLNGEEFSADSFAQCVKRARAHAGGKQKAENKLACSEKFLFEERKFAEGKSGWMIGFFLNADTAAKLAIPGGERVEDLHVTLCYLGELSIFDKLAVARALVEFERFFNWREPLAGEVSGLGRFQTSEGVDVIYASVDVPGLNELRADLVRNLASIGIKPTNEHGFDPHITLAFIPSDAPTPEWNVGEIPLRFDKATCAMGDERIEVSLKGGYFMYGEDGEKSVELFDLTSKNNGLTQLFMEMQQYAEPPEWIPCLPIPGEYTHGSYGKIIITRERNENFISNFDLKVYQDELPVDAEHETKLSGALGWITKMRMNDDGSVDAKVDWTDRGTSLIEADRFKYVSPEWYNQWTDPATETTFKDVLVGAALTTRPFFKEKALRPLVANEKGLFECDANIKNGDSTTFIFTALQPSVKTTKEKDTMSTPATPATATATEDKTPATTQQFNELLQKFNEMQQKFEASETKAAASEAEAKKANERAEKLEKEARTNRFSEQAEKFIGDKTKHVSLMEKMAVAFGEDSEELKDYIEQQTAAAEQAKTSSLFSEVGKGCGSNPASAEAQAEAKAKKLMSENKDLSMNDAIKQVFREDNALYERYREETMVNVNKSRT